MKLYVDDIRIAPEDWVQAWNAAQAIRMLSTGEVTDLSLDHDLGVSALATGYDIMLWIEYQVHTEDEFELPNIKFHTANPAGRSNMEAALKSIQRYLSG